MAAGNSLLSVGVAGCRYDAVAGHETGLPYFAALEPMSFSLQDCLNLTYNQLIGGRQRKFQAYWRGFRLLQTGLVSMFGPQL
jgi:hypothetical protein